MFYVILFYFMMKKKLFTFQTLHMNVEKILYTPKDDKCIIFSLSKPTP